MVKVANNYRVIGNGRHKYVTCMDAVSTGMDRLVTFGEPYLARNTVMENNL